MRTFIAIELESQIRDNIQGLITLLKKKVSHIRWVKPQGMHLTLKFLGEISPQAVPDIKTALQKAIPQHASFPLKLTGTGVFPPGAKHPRIIWIGIAPNQDLKRIKEALDKEMEDLKFPREDRKFHPHLTIGRVKLHNRKGLILRELEQFQEKEFGEMTVKEIILFKSTLKPSGAEYSKIYTANLT